MKRPDQNVVETAEAPQLLEEWVRRAEMAGASDIHLQRVAGGARVSFRLDGRMTPATTVADPVAERLFGRIRRCW